MPYDPEDEITEHDRLFMEKPLTLTKNELLYLSDSMTLLMEHMSEQGRVHIPARQLMPSAAVPVPIELIQNVGLGLLIATDPKNVSQEATVTFSVADLYLLRECCQSFVKINNELVGYNLLRKLYTLILEESMEEREFINRLTIGIDFSMQNIDKDRLQYLEELRQRHDTDNTV